MNKDIYLNIQILHQAGKLSSNFPEGWKGILPYSLGLNRDPPIFLGVEQGSSNLPEGWKEILKMF